MPKNEIIESTEKGTRRKICGCTCKEDLDCPLSIGKLDISTLQFRCGKCLDCILLELNVNREFNIVKFKKNKE